jgi:hypothetical protein
MKKNEGNAIRRRKRERERERERERLLAAVTSRQLLDECLLAPSWIAAARATNFLR